MILPISVAEARKLRRKLEQRDKVARQWVEARARVVSQIPALIPPAHAASKPPKHSLNRQSE